MSSTSVLAKDEMDLEAARVAVKKITPEQLLKMHEAAAELASMKDEMLKMRKQLEQRSLQAASERDAPRVDRRQMYDDFVKWLGQMFPASGREFDYEKAYLAQKVANSATFMGRNKKKRKQGILNRRNKAADQDLQGISQEFGVEVPQVELQRAEESLSTVNESIVRCKALQEVAAFEYTRLSGAKWETPPEVNTNANRWNGGSQSPDARSFHPREEDDIAF